MKTISLQETGMGIHATFIKGKLLSAPWQG